MNPLSSVLSAIKKVKVSDSWKVELNSAIHTFIAGFLLEVSLHINDFSMGSVSKDALFSLGLAALRSGVKALLSWAINKLK